VTPRGNEADNEAIRALCMKPASNCRGRRKWEGGHSPQHNNHISSERRARSL